VCEKIIINMNILLIIIVSFGVLVGLVYLIFALSSRKVTPHFNKLFVNRKIICLQQKKIEYGSEDTEYEVFILHIINSENGNPILSINLGWQGKKMLLMKDNLLFIYKNGTYEIFDAFKQNVVRTYSEKTLPKFFNEFSVGVDIESLKFVEEFEMLTVYGKDGKKWYINPFSHEIFSEEYMKNVKPVNAFWKDEKFKLEGEKNKILKQNYQHVNTNYTFLQGEILHIDRTHNEYFIVAYKTTDFDEPTLYCFSFEHELLWQKNKTLLGLEKSKEKKENFDVLKPLGDNVFFNFGEDIFLVNNKNGNIIWKSKYKI
jgi:hypothetical protein